MGGGCEEHLKIAGRLVTESVDAAGCCMPAVDKADNKISRYQWGKPMLRKLAECLGAEA